jgi:hypothetical protein
VRAMRAESEQMRLDLTTVMTRLTNVEAEMAAIIAKVEKTDKRTRG